MRRVSGCVGPVLLTLVTTLCAACASDDAETGSVGGTQAAGGSPAATGGSGVIPGTDAQVSGGGSPGTGGTPGTGGGGVDPQDAGPVVPPTADAFASEPPPPPRALFERDQSPNSPTTSVPPVSGGNGAASGETPQLGRTPMSVFRVVRACLESAASTVPDRSEIGPYPRGVSGKECGVYHPVPNLRQAPGGNEKARPEVSLADAPGLFSSGSASG